uniref:Secreted protein n=1 Tax=Chlamydomonas leiostraca TaxID=1034604 RepID=A0A7S0RM62_9CHLO|mmetsp:Transcript_25681/g.65232  ORF Transcript_25681/g.65232 Transcript_25681/m.65232 type:complete len:120 (+) Transcript_25681:854-1213(+)|eukprot:CAMPEP_0202885492 /NCGR_PEP_ID=MMETSP1391-20130828/41691_1 /ASSEMBLY_ACC=CAM_ASM_000867 /TAXON_ID=1034604 /ORGANISM="Chlamydomonas leiostraca, Strain SAG 11-49" /LENGTH=119 /DNA_ID=CAMNT_0049568743 /DNA_START=1569 /DNA_END=1928 /DNA_ORIENTATION=+
MDNLLSPALGAKLLLLYIYSGLSACHTPGCSKQKEDAGVWQQPPSPCHHPQRALLFCRWTCARAPAVNAANMLTTLVACLMHSPGAAGVHAWPWNVHCTNPWMLHGCMPLHMLASEWNL